MVKLEKRKGLAEAGPFEHPRMLCSARGHAGLLKRSQMERPRIQTRLTSESVSVLKNGAREPRKPSSLLPIRIGESETESGAFALFRTSQFGQRHSNPH